MKRLIEQFVPENYKLDINIDPKKMTFSGTVIVKGKKVGRPSQRITFHQKGLSISTATLTKHDKNGDEEITLDRTNKHETLHELRLHSKSMLYPGNYTAKISFEGKITDNMHGLYPCYFKHDGQDKFILATQFESHHAREVFPCIDEPEAKATFDLTLTTPDDGGHLSNMLETNVSKNKGLKTSTFETTPIMSTYLLAFAYGEVHHIEAKTKNDVLVRIFGHIGHSKDLFKFALKEAVDILEFYEDYFKTPFPLKKCDHIALPDFDVGAMENWGLITYRESALLTDSNNRSIPSEQYVANVISHELSHQWFGNLVTMKWWDDLWLNESFASLVEHMPLDKLHPDWHQWETYTAYDVISSSNRDIYKDVQSVGVDVNHPDEIHTLFDGAIVYSKGGRLLKMMREYIGDDVFRLATQQYFKDHAYKNTSREDLWQAMSNASKKDISKLMTPWLVQSGMPVLAVDEGKDKTKRKVTQSRFVFDKDDDTQSWPTPLLPLNEVSPQILEKDAVEIDLTDDSKPFMLNKNGSGHFVVQYKNKDDLINISSLMRSQKIPSEARINVLNDQLLLTRRGDISLDEVLTTVSKMNDEPRDAVWDMIGRAIGFASGMGEKNKTIEDGIKELKYKLAENNYKKLGWEDKESDDPNTRGLRATMIGFMLSSENQETIDFVLDYFDKTSVDKIPADRRAQVFSTIVKHGNNNKNIDMLIDLHKESQEPDMLQSITAGLCSTKDPVQAKRILDEGLGDGGFVKPQDYFRWYLYMVRNKHVHDVAWDWLVQNWDYLYKKLADSKALDYFVTFSAGSVYTKERQKKFHDFFDSKTDIISLSRPIKVATSDIEARIAWRDRDLKKVETFFKS